MKRWMLGPVNSGERFDFSWSKWVPNKCNIFMWRALLDSIPTKVALIRRCIMVDNPLCGWCDGVQESTEHILTGCWFASGLWSGVASWCGIPTLYVFHVKDIVALQDYYGMVGNKKLVFHGILIIACWRLWKARNEKIFENKEVKIIEVIADIKIFGYLWYKHRFKKGVVDWDRWNRFDIM